MSELSDQQVWFLNRFIGAGIGHPEDSSDAAGANQVAALASRVSMVVEKHPQSSAVLKGLLGAAKAALSGGDVTEFQRQTDMLTGRLGTLEEMQQLPDLKDVLDRGLLELSRELRPEEAEVLEAAYEEAQGAIEDFPDAIKEPAQKYVAELNRLRQRGEQLVERLKVGGLTAIERAAHHNEIDQICVQVEQMAADLTKLLEREGLL